MKKTHLVLAMLATLGLALAPLAAEAKSRKHHGSTSSTSTTTTGVNTKSKRMSNPPSQGSTNQGGSSGSKY